MNGSYYQEIIGLIAAVLGIISFVPQVVKIWQTRSVKDISYVMYLIYTTSLILWLIYGIMIKSLPIILAELFTLIFVLMILVMKYMWK